MIDSETTFKAININEKLQKLEGYWQPRVIAEMNDYQFKLACLKGDFIWHKHDDTDETFFVISGTLRLDFRDRQVEVGPGEIIVVPKGVEHKPYAEEAVQIMLIEPRGTYNTGDAGGERTVDPDQWI